MAPITCPRSLPNTPSPYLHRFCSWLLKNRVRDRAFWVLFLVIAACLHVQEACAQADPSPSSSMATAPMRTDDPQPVLTGELDPPRPRFRGVLTPFERHVLAELTTDEVARFEAETDPPLIAVHRNPSSAIGLRRLPLSMNLRSTAFVDGGRVELLPDRYVWVTYVESPGAEAIRLNIDVASLPEGALLFVYTDSANVLGPYDRATAGEYPDLWTGILFGAGAYVELQVPASVGAPGAPIELSIKAIAHFRDFGTQLQAAQLNCYEDVNCSTAKSFTGLSAVKQAVCSIIYPTPSGSRYCTGTLLKNTRNDGQPFVLTANHCVNNVEWGGLSAAYITQNSAFVFDYVSTSCGATSWSQSAVYERAKLLSTGTTSDHALMLMSVKPGGARTFLDWSTTEPPDNTILYSVHHPEGLPQKFTRTKKVFTIGCGAPLPYSGFYKTRHEVGANYRGSSGSPLVMLIGNVPRVIGQDTGSCPELFTNLNSCDFNTYTENWGRFDVTYPSVSTWLSGVATAGISLSAYSLSWGNTIVGAPATGQVVRVTNTQANGINLDVSRIVISGVQASDFTVTPTSMYIPPGESRDLSVSFRPNGVGTRSASIGLYHNATSPNPAVVQVSGIGANPVPSISGLVSTSTWVGEPSCVITVSGANFVGGSIGRWNGADRPTAYLSSGQVKVTLGTPDLAVATTGSITVFNPGPGGGTSNAQTFTVKNPAPSITTIIPETRVVGGGGFTLTVTGTRFVGGSGGSVVRWKGSARTTTFRSSTELVAQISSGDLTAPGTAAVTVFNPTPGGGESNSASFTIIYPTPQISSVSPASAVAGTGGFTLTVNGSDFLNGSIVRWKGVDKPTTYVSAVRLLATISSADIATVGNATVTVRLPDGSTSAGYTFPVNNPLPAITSLQPETVAAATGGFTLTVQGNSFVQGASVRWNGSPRTTEYVSGTTMRASIAASDIASVGSASITVANPAPGGGVSNASTLQVVAPTPVVTGVTPAAVQVGTGGTVLAVDGTGFMPNSVARWNGSDRTTAIVSATRLSVSILPTDLTAAGTASLVVFTPAPGGGTSTGWPISLVNPIPAISGLLPSNTQAGGGGTTLRVSGGPFVSGATVFWDESARTTEYVSAGELRIQLGAPDLATPRSVNVRVVNPSPGGGQSNTTSFRIDPTPLPLITALTPASVLVGSPDTQLQVDGANFISGSVVRWNGTDRATVFEGASRLRATIVAADLIAAGTASVTVFNPFGGGASSPAEFTVANPSPAIVALSPAGARAGNTAFTLRVLGSSFVSGSRVLWNGQERATTFVAATELQAAIAAVDVASPGNASVAVVSPSPGGGSSSPVDFLISNLPAPTLASLAPTTATVGTGGLTLTVNGADFADGAVVQWNGEDRVTLRESDVRLRATLLASDLSTARLAAVTVRNPLGGGTSSPSSFTVANVVPVVSALSPSTLTAGGTSFTLTVDGSGFVPGSIVRWSGNERPTTFVSTSRLTADIPATDIAQAGASDVTVFSPAPGGGASGPTPFVVSNPSVAVTSLTPASVLAGASAFTLTVHGTGFMPTTVVRVNGVGRPTTFVDGTRLETSIAESEVATAGTLQVGVFTAPPGGGASNTIALAVQNPVPAIVSLLPASATATGPAFTLTVNGTGFVSGAAVRWNGDARTTTFVGPTQLTAAITSADIATAGPSSVSVLNPGPGGGASSPVSIAVDNPLPVLTSISPLEAVAGSGTFALTANGSSFVASSRIQWGGVERPTTYLSGSQLTAQVGAEDLLTAGTVSVSVVTPGPGGGATSGIDFAITSAELALVQFAPRVEYGTPNQPFAVATGDLDEDGKPDVVVANVGAARVSVFPGVGDGTLGARTDYRTGSGPIALAVGDVDGDGHDDVVTTAIDIDSLSILKGNGDGTLQPRTQLPTGSAPRGVATGDLDRDGRSDIVVANQNASSLTVWLNRVEGWTRTDVPVGAGPRSVLITSVNGDPWPDLVCANGGSGQVSVLIGLGGGSFAEHVPYAVGSQPVALALGDLDHDWRVDVVAANRLSNSVSVLKGMAGGVLAPAVGHATGSQPADVRLGDLLQVGQLDIVTVDQADDAISVLIADGAGGVARRETHPAGQDPSGLAIADLDSDGRPDVVVADYGANKVSVLMNSTPRPQPTISALIPATIPAGHPGFTLMVNGSGFVRSSVVVWNGTARPTAFISSSVLQALIPASDLVQTGAAVVSVQSPAPGGGLSDALVIEITGAEQLPLTFEPRQDLLAINQPFAVATGDLDGNGKVDVVVADIGASRISAYLGAGDGTLGLRQDSWTGSGPAALALGDIDGDGVLDAATAGFDIDSVSILLGLGDGRFQPRVNLPAGSFPRGLAMDDLDGDGRADLAVANQGSDDVTLWLNRHSGWTRQDLACGVSPRAVALGTLNADPWPDIVVANGSANGISVFLSAGAGVYAPRADYPTGNQAVGVTLADIDHDGCVDVAVVNQTSRTVSVLHGSPSGTLSARVDYPTGSQPVAVLVADMFQTGHADIVTADYGSDSVSVHITNDRGDVQRRVTYPVGHQPTGLAVPDLDADGRPDVLASNYGSGSLTVLLNDTPRPTPVTSNISPSQAPIGHGDFELGVAGSGFVRSSIVRWNGQDRPTTFVRMGELRAQIPASDVAVMGSASVTVFTPAPGGGVSTPLGFQVTAPDSLVVQFLPRVDHVTPNQPFALATGDLDGDGLPDVIVANVGASQVSVYRGMEGGHLSPRTDFSTASGPMSVAVGDVTCDGKPDVVAACYDQGVVSILAGDGSGSLSRVYDRPAEAFVRSVALADVDADGRTDIVVANQGANSITVMLNRPTGWTPSSLPVGMSPRDVQIADLDNDGNLDLAVANGSSASVTVYRGVGTGSFALEGAYTVGSEPVALDIGDIDRDGWRDIVTANRTGGTVSVLKRLSQGGFANHVDHRTGRQPSAIRLGDLLGIGRLDIVTVNNGADSLSVLLADGVGGVRRRVDLPTQIQPTDLALCDLDVDGRLDVLATNYGSNSLSVLLNSTLSVLASPPATSPIALDLAPVRPNPSIGVANISYAVPKRSHVRLAIYDVSGRRVALLADGVQEPGRYHVAWGGKERKAARPGQYFVRFMADGRTLVRRLTLLR